MLAGGSVLVALLSLRLAAVGDPWELFEPCEVCVKNGDARTLNSHGCLLVGGDELTCSAHGACSRPGGSCICTDGYSGEKCEVPLGGFPDSLPNRGMVTRLSAVLTPTSGLSRATCLGNTNYVSGFGGWEFTTNNLPPGIEGIAQVNPDLFGVRRYDPDDPTGKYKTPYGLPAATTSDGCFLCYKLSALESVGGTHTMRDVNVIVVGRCEGECQGSSPSTCKVGGKSAATCDKCLMQNEPAVSTCSCFKNGGMQLQCPGTTAACNFCDNSHPHFELDRDAFLKVCGANNIDGFCELNNIEPIACDPVRGDGMWPNGFHNLTKTKVPTAPPTPTVAPTKVPTSLPPGGSPATTPAAAKPTTTTTATPTTATPTTTTSSAMLRGNWTTPTPEKPVYLMAIGAIKIPYMRFTVDIQERIRYGMARTLFSGSRDWSPATADAWTKEVQVREIRAFNDKTPNGTFPSVAFDIVARFNGAQVAKLGGRKATRGFMTAFLHNARDHVIGDDERRNPGWLAFDMFEEGAKLKNIIGVNYGPEFGACAMSFQQENVVFTDTFTTVKPKIVRDWSSDQLVIVVTVILPCIIALVGAFMNVRWLCGAKSSFELIIG